MVPTAPVTCIAKNVLKRCIAFSCGCISARFTGAWCLRCAMCGCGTCVKITLLPHAGHVCAPGVRFAPHFGQDDMVFSRSVMWSRSVPEQATPETGLQVGTARSQAAARIDIELH